MQPGPEPHPHSVSKDLILQQADNLTTRPQNRALLSAWLYRHPSPPQPPSTFPLLFSFHHFLLPPSLLHPYKIGPPLSLYKLGWVISLSAVRVEGEHCIYYITTVDRLGLDRSRTTKEHYFIIHPVLLKRYGGKKIILNLQTIGAAAL